MVEVLKAENLVGGYEFIVGEKRVYVDAVSNVNIGFEESLVYGIAGESGCGKSTLLKLLYGFLAKPLTVKSGNVKLYISNNYIDILRLSDDVRRYKVWWKEISWIPQNAMSVLNPVQRIRDHFTEILTVHMDMDKEDALKYSLEHVEGLGLSKDVLNAYPHQLSGGMRQRVVIALALLLKPKIVLADEPTSALDVVVQRGVMQMLLDKQKEMKNSLVLVSHDMGIHAMVTNRLAIMYAGKVVEFGDTDAVFEKPLHPYTKALIDSLPRIGDKNPRQGLSGSPPDLSNPPPGCRFHPRCPFAMDICRKEIPPTIEIEKNRYVSCWLYAKR
ncbi:ABC transporter ATP-binding protein [Ignisphaera sp. 4213-co]|uniref:ABC transporter ATP-binding protein n=1 Tax=Ignisphaera cupida TaxID=3050454 RepID=A0ABD4Z590_9CREN|nr:ABC transporter ATP-binding protein [Ignisphaera sp. 4213-co]MDK6028476.1 ABC transporter ATP-binding protein [Ignisphaera sp. 4213-co]